jgi:hypothetical protein
LESMTFGKIILAAERATVVKMSTDTQVGRKAVAIDNMRLFKTPLYGGVWVVEHASV